MTFVSTWNNLLDNVEELPSDATLVTPLSRKVFRVTDVQEHRVLIQYRDDEETIPLQRDQFETLYRRIQDARGEFELDRLPPDAEPYATVLSLHPRFEVDDREGTLTESETPKESSDSDRCNSTEAAGFDFLHAETTGDIRPTGGECLSDRPDRSGRACFRPHSHRYRNQDFPRLPGGSFREVATIW